MPEPPSVREMGIEGKVIILRVSNGGGAGLYISLKAEIHFHYPIYALDDKKAAKYHKKVYFLRKH